MMMIIFLLKTKDTMIDIDTNNYHIIDDLNYISSNDIDYYYHHHQHLTVNVYTEFLKLKKKIQLKSK